MSRVIVFVVCVLSMATLLTLLLRVDSEREARLALGLAAVAGVVVVELGRG